MDNLTLYNKVRSVPPEAQKSIVGGRLKGKTDINPIWRIKSLTEQFGPCGIGWYLEITKQWTEAGANGEISAFVNINLYIKSDGEWSKPISGTGGSSFVAKESSGLYTSDECYKMAMTDAISVACKMLGFGADVYWEKDSSKYDKPEKSQNPPQQSKPVGNDNHQLGNEQGSKNDFIHICADCNSEVTATKNKTVEQILADGKKYYQLTLCQKCINKRYKAAHPEAS